MPGFIALALRHWQAVLGVLAAALLLTLLHVRTGQRDDARATIERERAAIRLFAARVEAASERIRADMAAHALAVARRQAQINEETSRDYQTRLADLRRRADALRLRGAADRTDPGRAPGSAGMPGLPGSPGRPDAAAGPDGLSPAELDWRLTASEQAVQLEGLQEWVRRQQTAFGPAAPSR